VVITPGAKSALYSAMVALIEEGSDVLMPDPGFPAYASITSYLGARPVYYGLNENNGFSVSASELESKLTPKTKVLILNYPHNPSGGSITDKDIKEIAELAIRKNLYVIADEIYAELQYVGSFYSIQSLPEMAERTIIVDGFSKSYAMTGWRLGWIVLPERVAGEMSTLATNTFSCAPSFVQRAGIVALRSPQDCVREMCKEYEARSRIVTDLLNAIPGVKCALPRGAFYAFPDVRGVLQGKKSAELAHELLYEHGVALLPGTAFGASGEGFLRVSYANSRENIVEGVRRVAEGVAALM
jgi:aspartate aminotransferase